MESVRLQFFLAILRIFKLFSALGFWVCLVVLILVILNISRETVSLLIEELEFVVYSRGFFNLFYFLS